MIQRKWDLQPKCFVTSLVEIGQGVLENKVFQKVTTYFCYKIIVFTWRTIRPFIWTNINPLHQRMICAMSSWNWPSESCEEIENVKRLQSCKQMDRWTARESGRWQVINTFSSGKLTCKFTITICIIKFPEVKFTNMQVNINRFKIL